MILDRRTVIGRSLRAAPKALRIPMNAPDLPLLPEVLLGTQPADQPPLELASAGVQRYVWHSAFGDMLIEVCGGVAYVNGQRVATIDDLRAEG